MIIYFLVSNSASDRVAFKFKCIFFLRELIYKFFLLFFESLLFILPNFFLFFIPFNLDILKFPHFNKLRVFLFNFKCHTIADFFLALSL